MRVFKHHSGSVLLAYLFAIGLSAFAAPLNPKVVLVTNRGDITIELFYHEAPITVDNFLTYVNSEFYNGLIFHRVENRGYLGGTLDVIQGGACYYYNYNFYFPSTNDPIINESFNGLSNVRGTIAMARSATPNSATAQFYINHKDNIELDKENDPYGYGYCVFGRVIEGIDIVDTIASAP
jgi:peptidyl-prolyl cis-trans isomerase A (cyclophilin A)/peptidyl-prolyl cis-trans isomerase B (cyclophilin B)